MSDQHVGDRAVAWPVLRALAGLLVAAAVVLLVVGQDAAWSLAIALALAGALVAATGEVGRAVHRR